MFSVYTDYNTLNRKINRDFKKPLLAFDEIYGSAAQAEQKEFMQVFIERIDLYPVLHALKYFLIKRLRSLLEHIKRTADFSHSATSQRSVFRYSVAMLNVFSYGLSI